ncbi:hypothetical protein AGMMS49593_10600 [Endomicrobiia bacterium]|nr:hypothetical protein AGMMS49593_10600 [Endomicrobiia bacterium]
MSTLAESAPPARLLDEISARFGEISGTFGYYSTIFRDCSNRYRCEEREERLRITEAERKQEEEEEEEEVKAEEERLRIEAEIKQKAGGGRTGRKEEKVVYNS